MAATEIENFVIVFPDPLTTPVESQRKTRVSHNISYAQNVESNIRTLSVNDADGSGVVSGLLYVPDLHPSNPCAINPYVPSNATRQEQLPATDFNLVALAPWFNTTCTLAYFESARYDPIRAFIFYLPDNGTSIPPVSSDPTWDLDDGGAWKKNGHFPVYVIPGFIGSQFMTALSQYSGNVTQVPNGHELIELGVYPSEFIRVYTEIGVTSSTSLPSLWIFLLVVLGVLAIVLVTTSMTLHLLQRARREDLERRVMRGQVDLEALGIKRLTVPMDIIQTMPLFIYAYHAQILPTTKEELIDAPSSIETVELIPEIEGSTSDPSTIYRIKIESTISTKEHGYTPSTGPLSYQPDSQPSCHICLEDFTDGVSVIRELPCWHIFHPECIDTFLSESSSLCPVCKKSVLPLGYCPVPITNFIARRERAVRRLRNRVTVTERTIEEGRWQQLRARFALPLRRPATVELPQRVRPIDSELLASTADSALSRQDIARARAGELTGLRDADLEGRDRRPAWRRSISRVFPV